MDGDNDTRAVLRSERGYEALVVALYPRSFRARYAREMRLVFWQLCRDAYRRRGVAGLVHAWLNELPALVVGAICERNTTMTRTIAAIGRAGVAKAIMMANATALTLFGAALFASAVTLLRAYGFVEPSQVPGPGAPDGAWLAFLPVQLMTQTLGEPARS